ncbi:MAG: methyltransferase domain-containing protein [Chloroflexi bacterium]|nr:methyltransferase domain-containing protein [Chloroflexota bacterium]
MDYKGESARGWSTVPAGWSHAKEYEPGTKEFFEQVLAKRSTQEMPWLFEVIPFAQTRGQKVLELGHGAGYDAYAFCQNGADYTGIDIAPANPARLRAHLGFFDFHPNVMLGDAENLMFPDGCFDVVFSNGVLHHTPDIGKAFRETYRVLKPGGQFWVIVYHRDSVFHWWSWVFFRYILLGNFRRQSYRDALSDIESVQGSAKPLVNVYSRRQVAALLRAAGFVVDEIKIRKLEKQDVASPGFVYRWAQKHIPQRWYDKVGEYFGWYIIAKGRKPLV